MVRTKKHFHPVPGVRDLPFESAFKPTQLCGGNHHITTRRLRPFLVFFGFTGAVPICTLLGFLRGRNTYVC